MAEETTLTVTENPAPAAPITSVKIDDGTRKIPFLNQDDEVIGVLRFRPADMGLIDRYKEAVTRWPELSEAVDEAAEAADESGEESYRKAKTLLFEIMDFLLDGPVSAEIFAKINPFNPVGQDGEMFCEVVFDTVQKLIEQEFSVQLAKRAEREKRMEKYRPNRQQRRAAARQ